MGKEKRGKRMIIKTVIIALMAATRYISCGSGAAFCACTAIEAIRVLAGKKADLAMKILDEASQDQIKENDYE
ncbi:MAG: hypothetical protein ACLRYB_18360 [Segatella copri]